MLIYIGFAILPIIIGAFFPRLHENIHQKRQYYFICCLVAVFIIGCRHYCLGSTDTLNYYNAMRRAIASPSWSSYYHPDYFEVGAQFFIYALSRLFKDPQWLIVVTSLIYIVSIIYCVDRNSDDIPLSITAYISLGLMQFHMQGMRQSLAMCVCLFAYEQAKKKHLAKFVLLVLLAMTFHQTAIVFLPVYFFAHMKHSKKNLLLMAGGATIAVLLADNIINIANALFDRSYYASVDSGGFVATLIYIIILITSLLYYKSRNAESDTHAPLVYLLILGMVSYVMRYVGTLAAERISFYFAFSQLLLLPKAIKIVVEKDRKLIRFLIILLAVALFAYRLNRSDFVPYKFFWQ